MNVYFLLNTLNAYIIIYVYFGRVYMRIFDAHTHALLLNTIYMGTKHAYIYMGTKQTYICVYKTRIYLRTKRAYTSELLVLLAGITNSI